MRRGGHTRHTLFGAFAAAWLARRQAEGLRSTIDYESTLRCHLLPAFGARRIGDIRTPEIRDFVAELRARDGAHALSGRRVLNIYGLLRNILNDAQAAEIIDRQPACLRGKDLPENTDADPRFRRLAMFTVDEMRRLVRADVPLFWRVLYVALFSTGARIGELLALRWRDVHLELDPLGRIDIAVSFSQKRGAESAPKTKLAREVPILPPLAAMLRAWCAAGDWGPVSSPGALVFPGEQAPTRHGGHLSPSTVLERLQGDLSWLGLRKRRVHDARRTYISLACNSEGVDLQVIRRVTHLRPGDVHSAYREIPWDVTCREAMKIGPLVGLEVQP